MDRLAAYSWRFLLIAIAAWAAAWLLWRLRLVVFPVIAATLLTVVLAPPARWLRGHRWPPAAATWAVMTAFFGALGLVGWLVVPAVVDEVSGLGPTVEEAVDDIEDWLVEDSFFGLDRAEVEDLRREAGEWATDTFVSSPGAVFSRAVVVVEAIAGVVLSFVMAFFLLKDGERLQRWATARLPEPHRELARRLAIRARRTLAGYLRGSALLGTIEAIIIGTAVAIAGSDLVVPIMVITFLAAFVPFAGAVVAGVVAVLVTLVSAGLAPAAVVAAVALVVQQFDNDVLAPVVFGHALSLHPLVVLLSLAVGAALMGLAGAVLAVPFVAVAVNVGEEFQQHRSQHGGRTDADLRPTRVGGRPLA